MFYSGVPGEARISTHEEERARRDPSPRAACPHPVHSAPAAVHSLLGIFPRRASESSTATPCSGARHAGTTRSCVLGLTSARSRRIVGGSLETAPGIAREVAGQAGRTSAERGQGPASRDALGTKVAATGPRTGIAQNQWSQDQPPRPDGAAEPGTNARSHAGQAIAQAWQSTGRDFASGSNPQPEAGSRPPHQPGFCRRPPSYGRSGSNGRQPVARPDRADRSRPAAPTIKRRTAWRRGAISGPCRTGVDSGHG